MIEAKTTTEVLLQALPYIQRFRGKVVVSKESPFGPSKEIAVLEPPACFGEMAVLDGSDRSATVTSEGDTQIFCFPRDHFQGLLDQGELGALQAAEQLDVAARAFQQLAGQRPALL